MKRKRTGFRVEVYWEEFGTTAEGTMEDPRYHEVSRRPSAREMTKIEKGLAEILKKLGLMPQGR
jgi:hypothetical protein